MEEMKEFWRLDVRVPGYNVEGYLFCKHGLIVRVFLLWDT